MARTPEAQRDTRAATAVDTPRVPGVAIATCFAAVASFAWAISVSLTGGFVLAFHGVRLSSHRILPPYLLGIVFMLLTARGRGELKRLGSRSISPVVLTTTAACVAPLTLVIGVLFGAFTAVGDAFGYIAEANLWLDRSLFRSQGPTLAMHWANAAAALCPVGFRPSATWNAMVPVYSAGLPLLMAACKSVLGENGVFVVVPLAGAVVVYSTFRLGRIWMDRTTGLVAAILVAASPVFLLQLVQPMSDVPVTACLLAAIVAACDRSWRGAVGAGLASSIGFLIRPNLAPLALPLAAWVFLFPAAATAWQRFARLFLFGASLAPLCLLVAWIQFTLYGSPLASGYGRASDIYAFANLVPNLARYPRWLLETHTPFVLLGLLAPLVSSGRRTFAWLGVAFALSVVACYVFYIPFEHWGYLRFLLPALPLLILLAAGCGITLLRRFLPDANVWIALAAGLLVLLDVNTAVRGDVFALQRAFREQFRDVAGAVRTVTRPDALVVGLVHTTSVSYYARRQTVRYDLIEPADLDHVVADLRSAGYKPYLLVTLEEESAFRARFAARSRTGGLRCEAKRVFAGRVRLYDLVECGGT